MNPAAHVVNGPTDLTDEQLAERKRLASIDYYHRELATLRESARRLDGDVDKVAETNRMIATTEAALAAAQGD